MPWRTKSPQPASCGWRSRSDLNSMSNQSLPRIAGLVLGVSVMMAGAASADALEDEIAPTGKLRVAIAIRSEFNVQSIFAAHCRPGSGGLGHDGGCRKRRCPGGRNRPNRQAAGGDRDQI